MKILACAALQRTAARLTRRAGWSLDVSRYQIALRPRPRRNCPRCHGEGGWWVGGPFPEMEACPCWADRPTRAVRLLPIPAHTERPF